MNTETILRVALREGKDPFVEVAAVLYSTPSESVTKLQRQFAKAAAYQNLRGAGDLPADLHEVFRRG